MANLNLIEWAKRLDPNGSVAIMANILSQTNEVLTDMVVVQGNLPTGHRCTIVTGLPTTYYRAINQGVPTSKGNTVQVDEGIAMAEAWSEIDTDLADLNGNTAEFRLSESKLFIESMNQTISTGIFYGNPADDPKQFLGLTQRYSDPAAGNGQNMISAEGATVLQQTSMWFVCWGENFVFAPFPKGSRAGLMHENLGRLVSFDAGGAGLRMKVYSDHYQWKTGLVVKDWRSVVRICNIDTVDFKVLGNELNPNSGNYLDIVHLMIKAYSRIPKGIIAMSRPVIYANASLFAVLMRTAMEKSAAALGLEKGMTQFGKTHAMMTFLGIPIRQCDAILNTEAVVSGTFS